MSNVLNLVCDIEKDYAIVKTVCKNLNDVTDINNVKKAFETGKMMMQYYAYYTTTKKIVNVVMYAGYLLL